MNTTRFRGLVAIGATLGMAAGAAQIIRRRYQGKSSEPTAPVVERFGSPVRATDGLTNEVGQAKAGDLRVIGSGAQHSESLGGLPPSKESGPSLDLTSDRKLPAAQTRDTREPSFIGYWIAILLIVALGCGIASYHFLKQGFVSNDNPPQATGGLLMFTPEPISSQVQASLMVDSYKTGWPGISVLDMTLVFEHARPGLRWFIAASGQYAPKIDMPLGAFCPDISAVQSRSIIVCRNNAAHGSRDVTYNFKDRIGALVGQRQIRDITDSLPGYINTNAVILSGVLTRSYQVGLSADVLATRIVIPIRTPLPIDIGGDKYFAYAPIAITYQGDFGTGASLGQIAAPYSGKYFADSATRTPLNYLPISSLDLSIEGRTGKDQLSRASPPTLQSDELRWHTSGEGIGAISFTLHDPFAADQLSRSSFIAGILISIGASALLLLLEKLVEWWIRRRRLRALNHRPAQSGTTRGQANLGTRASGQAPLDV